MRLHKLVLFLGFLSFSLSSLAQEKMNGPILFQKDYQSNPNKIVDIALKGEKSKIIRGLQSDYKYKYSVQNWHYFRLSLSQIKLLLQNQLVEQVYYAYEAPQMMADTMRALTNTNQVHQGLGGLQVPYTGRDVIMGVIDTGIDFNHEDFKNDDGSTRVLYYWDHSLGFDPQRTPSKYGYGQVWNASDIDNGNCTSMDNHAHGSTVTGCAAGNGRATGFGKGVAPNADLIIVETDFGLSNWSLTIADAVDYIFSMADTLGKPAVINASVGSYLGSHDGKDPASLIIDSLLNDKNGRLFVCAGGNSGNQGKYHVNGTVLSDTSFTWFKVNNNSAFGGPGVYFDLWADTVDFYQAEFTMGAESRDPYLKRDYGSFITMQDFVSNNSIEDTLWNSFGQQIGTIEWYGSIVDDRFHLEVLVTPDSTDYYYSFNTVGTGNYQLWSGEFLQLNYIPFHPDSLPDLADYPDLQYYQYPDDESSIVSAWACLESTITVANYQNRKQYIDVNGVQYVSSNTALEITPTSSKGPTRTGLLKPDIAAPGDLIMSACPLWYIPSLLSLSPSPLLHGGMHLRNGGTSMSSPVVAGVGALYLERCNNASHTDFKADLLAGAFDDSFTGTTPNLTWGYGKVDAFATLNRDTISTSILADTAICDGVPANISLTNPGVFTTWSNGMSGNSISIATADTIWAITENNKSCKSYSDTVILQEGNAPNPAQISFLSNGIFASPAYNYTWSVDNTLIVDENSQFMIPQASGNYQATLYDQAGCSALSNILYVDYLSIKNNDTMELMVFPNPVENQLYILIQEENYNNIDLINTSGMNVLKQTMIISQNGLVTIDCSNLSSGAYILSISTDQKRRQTKIIKQ